MIDSSESCRSFIENEIPKLNFLDGNLSIELGFLPKIPPSTDFPDLFNPWKTFALQLNTLFFSNNTQQLLEQMPILDALQLEDRHLPQAATVLSLLACAYWRHGLHNFLAVRNNIETATLPKSISVPWTIVCQRLGRNPVLFQSANDLFLNNFKLREGIEYIPENVKIENLEVLWPAFGNEAERVFYMSFVEIHAASYPIVALICDIEDVMQGLLPEVEKMELISHYLKEISKNILKATKAFMKISPMRQSKNYCDPVIWAKTIGIFALPPANFPQGGTSGTSTPILHLLDALVSRKKFDSYYGEYVKNTSFPLLDQKTQGFVRKVAQMNLKKWINDLPQSEGKDAVANSYNAMVTRYLGGGGFLDKHLSKVFNYLGVSTMVGRNQSTSGHERFVSSETWNEVCEHLKVAITERVADIPIEVVAFTSEAPNSELPQIDKIELARHYKPDDAWIQIDQSVYDVTKFLGMHPGGAEILQSYLGRDCTTAFKRISGHAGPHINKMLKRMEIGRISNSTSCATFNLYETLIYELQKAYSVLNMNNAKTDDLKSTLVLRVQAHRLFIGEQLSHIRSYFKMQEVKTYKIEIDTYLETANLNETSDTELERMIAVVDNHLVEDQALITKMLDGILGEKAYSNLFFTELITDFELRIYGSSQLLPNAAGDSLGGVS